MAVRIWSTMPIPAGAIPVPRPSATRSDDMPPTRQGGGLPTSMLPADVQDRLESGKEVSSEEIEPAKP